MKTFWQIFCNWNKEQVCTLRQHNIEIEEGAGINLDGGDHARIHSQGHNHFALEALRLADENGLAIVALPDDFA